MKRKRYGITVMEENGSDIRRIAEWMRLYDCDISAVKDAAQSAQAIFKEYGSHVAIGVGKVRHGEVAEWFSTIRMTESTSDVSDREIAA